MTRPVVGTMDYIHLSAEPDRKVEIIHFVGANYKPSELGPSSGVRELTMRRSQWKALGEPKRIAVTVEALT